MQDTGYTPDPQLLEERRLQRLAQKRKRKIQQRAVLAVLLVIVVLIAVLLVRGARAQARQNAEEQAEQTETEQRPDQAESEAVLQTEPDTQITIAAVGDIMIYEDMLEAAEREGGGYDFMPGLSVISGLTVSPDLTIGNLELNFCEEPYGCAPSWSAPPELAATLSALGFDVLQTANTYSIQNGLLGLQSTNTALRRVGIDPVGTFESKEERAATGGVLLKNVNGLRVAFIAFTKGFGGLSLPEGEEYAANVLYEDYASEYSRLDEQALLNSVEAAQALAPDVIIAMLHWGSEADTTVTKEQEKVVTLLFENGVDAIIGSHPHIVGRMERRSVQTVDGRQKNCFVAYSLGNFFSSMDERVALHCRQSVVLELQFTRNGETGETALSDVSYTPICLMDYGEQAEVRFELLPVRSAVSSGLFPEKAQELTDAIAFLRSATQSDFDSGR